jgi:hypothetical protein
MTPDEFRRRAKRCFVFARRTLSPENREALIDVALIWMRIAARLEGNTRGAQSSPRGKRKTG